MRKFLLSGVSALALVTGAQAQVSPNVVTETATTPRSGVVCQSVQATVATQNTLTFAVPAGQSLYLTHLYLAAAQDATGGAATNLNFTSTNLGSTTAASSLAWQLSAASGANTMTVVAQTDNPNGFVKSAVGPLNVTIISPASQTHIAFPMNACGFLAP